MKWLSRSSWLLPVMLAGCAGTPLPTTTPTSVQTGGHVTIAISVTTTPRGAPAVSPEVLGDWVGRAAQEFAEAGVELQVASVEYVRTREADPRTRRGRRTLASRAPAGVVPVVFVHRVAQRTRGEWSPRDGVIVVGREATPTTLTHELGHALGLDHRADPTNIMCSCDRKGTPTFSSDQRDHLRVAALGPRR